MPSNQPALFDPAKDPARYKPAALWYDSTDKRLVVLVNGQPVPVVEPVLPGLEVVPDAVRHVGWNDPVTPANQAHIMGCQVCQARFGGRQVDGNPGEWDAGPGKRGKSVGIPQAGPAAQGGKKP